MLAFDAVLAATSTFSFFECAYTPLMSVLTELSAFFVTVLVITCARRAGKGRRNTS